MAKNKKIETTTNRVYPIKVRLVKPNEFNSDKIKINDIEIFTYKDVEIANVEMLNKLHSVQKYLVIKSELKECKSEVKEESFEEISE